MAHQQAERTVNASSVRKHLEQIGGSFLNLDSVGKHNPNSYRPTVAVYYNSSPGSSRVPASLQQRRICSENECTACSTPPMPTLVKVSETVCYRDYTCRSTGSAEPSLYCALHLRRDLGANQCYRKGKYDRLTISSVTKTFGGLDFAVDNH